MGFRVLEFRVQGLRFRPFNQSKYKVGTCCTRVPLFLMCNFSKETPNKREKVYYWSTYCKCLPNPENLNPQETCVQLCALTKTCLEPSLRINVMQTQTAHKIPALSLEFRVQGCLGLIRENLMHLVLIIAEPEQRMLLGKTGDEPKLQEEPCTPPALTKPLKVSRTLG